VIRSYGLAAIFLLKHLCRIGYSIEGKENIPTDTSIIFCKHQSTWETLALQVYFPPQTFVIKRQLLLIPFFGWGLSAMNPIAIDRGAGRSAITQIVKQGIERLKNGIWIVIFPEGTRGQPGKKTKYKLGGAILAVESGYPIVPVAHNAGSYWPKGQFLKKPGSITMVIGPSIQTKGRKPEEVMAEAEQWIETQMKRIQPLEKLS
jgi:1-acyl-sn-glycerol-3-phosphate acyltransferase